MWIDRAILLWARPAIVGIYMHKYVSLEPKDSAAAATAVMVFLSHLLILSLCIILCTRIVYIVYRLIYCYNWLIVYSGTWYVPKFDSDTGYYEELYLFQSPKCIQIPYLIRWNSMHIILQNSCIHQIQTIGNYFVIIYKENK